MDKTTACNIATKFKIQLCSAQGRPCGRA